MGMDDILKNPKEHELLARYTKLHDQFKNENPGLVAPKWAYHFAPPIPFVGASYGEGRAKVLIYASAENLTYTRKPKGDRPWLLPENQMIRSRKYNACLGGTSVHIQPINNGSLL